MARKPAARAKADQAAEREADQNPDATTATEAPTAPASYGDEIDEILKPVKLAAPGLIGELGDFFLSQKKAAAHLKAWEKMTKEEQEEWVEQSRHQAVKLVAGVVQAISTQGLPHMAATIQSFSGKTGEKTLGLKMEVMASAENAMRLVTGAGAEVVIVLASPSAFEGKMKQQAEDDQPELPTGEVADGDDDAGEEHDPDTGEVKPTKTPGGAPAQEPIAAETEAAANQRAP